LHPVGVLELVDQQMSRARLPSREHLGKLLEEQVGLELEIAEVHRIHGFQPLLVEPVQIRDRSLASLLGAREHRLGDTASFLACSIRDRTNSGGGESASAASSSTLRIEVIESLSSRMVKLRS